MRWQGWDSSWDTWESGLGAEIVEEFEDEQLALATPKATPKQPFTVELVGDETTEARSAARDRCPAKCPATPLPPPSRGRCSSNA